MKRKIYLSMVVSVLAASLCISLLLMIPMHRLFTEHLQSSLSGELAFMVSAMNLSEDPRELLSGMDQSQTRITWIATNGEVLYESDAPSDAMENHSDRPEIIQALETGAGDSSRLSKTFNEKTHYYAARLKDGSVLRLSAPRISVSELAIKMAQMLFFIVLAVLILIMLASSRITKAIVRPLNRLDLETPLEKPVYDELRPLVSGLDAKNRQIKRQIAQLQKQQTEFAAITENMSEGLVVLNAQGCVLSMNMSAQRLFGVEGKIPAGEYIFILYRNAALSKAVNAAMAGRTDEQVMELNHRYYQLIATPVLSEDDGHVSGIVLLIPDITDRYDAERSRREFTANVSHELKTPLTTILGYTELMQNGLVSPEDNQDFINRIHNAARQLLQLIEDTIRLSRLDESGAHQFAFEPVNITEIARSACERLKLLADSQGISMRVEGEDCIVSGSPRLLKDALFNLADNAVKYNRPNGSVVIRTERVPGGVRLSVKDTGIGIPSEHHHKIFERFYRVDKSHSRETGGTGLGLSIVKHVVQIHGAALTIQSIPGEGTEIAITFHG